MKSNTLTSEDVLKLSFDSGFYLSGIASALPHPDSGRYQNWVTNGFAGDMRYLTDHRAEKRLDPRSLLSSAQSILCVGMLYNGPQPYSTSFTAAECAWISRYAWGDDYHDILRRRLESLVAKLQEHGAFEYKICVDTAPLLERTYAREAGLGWIAKNTCLINQEHGSWFFLGEILTSLDLRPGSPPPDRCGSCTRCIDACPTAAIGPEGIDSRLCISYLTIELRAPIPETIRSSMGNHVFGCDICQDVCPWNRKAPVTAEPGFAPRHFAPPLDRLAALTAEEFRRMFRDTPIDRARYSGFLRNVAVAMGNQPSPRFREPLERLAASPDPMVAEHASWALMKLHSQG